MRRKKFTALLVVLALTLCLASAFSLLPASQARAGDVIKLNFSTMFPRMHLQAQLNQLYCDMIAKATGGKVKITLFPGGTLTSPPKNYDGVVKGVSDIGMSCPLYVGGRFPVSQIFEMPSAITNGWVTAMVYNDLYKKYQLKEYEDVHVLYLHGPGRNTLSTSSKPIRSLADMKGLVLRCSGGAAAVIQGWGATPRAMHMGDAFEALSKGVVGGQFSMAETLKGWKHAEVVKYLIFPPVSTSSCQYVVINKKKWDSFPPDVQKAFTEVSAQFPAYHGHVWIYTDLKGVEYFKSLPGREVINIPESQKAEWQAAVKPVVDAYVKDKTAMGLPAAEYLAYFHERIKHWEAKTPDIKESVAWVEANLLKK